MLFRFLFRMFAAFRSDAFRYVYSIHVPEMLLRLFCSGILLSKETLIKPVRKKPSVIAQIHVISVSLTIQAYSLIIYRIAGLFF